MYALIHFYFLSIAGKSEEKTISCARDDPRESTYEMPNDFFKSGLEKKRGFCNSYSDKNIVLVQLYDNRVVYTGSKFVGVQPIKAVKRFSQRQK